MKVYRLTIHTRDRGALIRWCKTRPACTLELANFQGLYAWQCEVFDIPIDKAQFVIWLNNYACG